MSNSEFDAAMLGQFTGTEHYYRISPSTVITDGCKFLADEAGSYWLMDAIASYLPQFTGREEFISAKLNVTRGSAELVLDNGNGKVLDRQHIPFTDFPLPAITLYACWGGDFWVLLLPSEY
ncbi:hypothetical protein G6694_03670 [Polynucleobacter paneuropaeus]|nr:hypothetical protein [Polynucleobacter paneuropaeus]